MAVQIVSDLHLESPKAYDVFEIEPRAPVLALLGDIGYAGAASHKRELIAFLERHLRQFRAVLYVLGNHEAYNSTWAASLATLQLFEADVRQRRSERKGRQDRDKGDATLGEFVLMDRTMYRLPDNPNTVILGCSLFSHIPPGRVQAVEMGINDFYRIDDPANDGWSVESHNCAHSRDLAWLNMTVEMLEKDVAEGTGGIEGGIEDVGGAGGASTILIFTHWSPTLDARGNDPRHIGDERACAFASDLSSEKCFRSAKVKTWAFGHTHYNCDFAVERSSVPAPPLRLVTNQRGYYFAQAAGYVNDKTL